MPSEPDALNKFLEAGRYWAELQASTESGEQVRCVLVFHLHDGKVNKAELQEGIKARYINFER